MGVGVEVEVEAGDVGKLLADYFVDVGRTASGPIEMPAQQTKQPHMERDMWEMEPGFGVRGWGWDLFGPTNGQRRQTLRRRQQRI